ncbi:MAG TPA: OmpA family protein [Myxococcota bacterium]|nr:OmpA family protein [Myxococcota bacterium]
MTLLRVIAAGLVAVLASACAGQAPKPWVCALIGAGALGGGGAAIGAETKSGHNGGAIGAGAAIGAVVGAATGYAICSALQKEEVKPAPPPPPPPKAAPAPPPMKEKIVLRGVNFAFDKYNISPDAAVILDEAAAILKRNPDVRVNVDGYTDSIGTKEYNQKLSERRAGAVADYLAKQGVNRSNLTPRGFGMDNPVASNKTKEGRAMNRRVELLVQGQ